MLPSLAVAMEAVEPRENAIVKRIGMEINVEVILDRLGHIWAHSLFGPLPHLGANSYGPQLINLPTLQMFPP